MTCDKYLINQFKSASGIEKLDINFKFLEDIELWTALRKKASNLYMSVLDDVGVIPSASVAEIGKTGTDSLAQYDGISTIITPYKSTFNKNVQNQIIEAELLFSGERIKLMANKNEIVLENPITRYITHNPYGDVSVWTKILENGKNITIGVFGNINDKDIEEKIEQLENVKNVLEQYKLFNKRRKELGNLTSITFTEENDCYAYVITSKFPEEVLQRKK